jgi:hypothetical protein
MGKGGRPPKVNIDDLINDADEYIKTADPPIVNEYAHLHNITGNYLYHLADKLEGEGKPELKHTIKKIAEAKAVILEKKTLNGQYNSSMAIFSLKQLGWKDKQEEKSEDDDLVKKFLEELKGHD